MSTPFWQGVEKGCKKGCKNSTTRKRSSMFVAVTGGNCSRGGYMAESHESLALQGIAAGQGQGGCSSYGIGKIGGVPCAARDTRRRVVPPPRDLNRKDKEVCAPPPQHCIQILEGPAGLLGIEKRTESLVPQWNTPKLLVLQSADWVLQKRRFHLQKRLFATTATTTAKPTGKESS